jgi:hypothetical protein
MSAPYSPLDKLNLGRSVAAALLNGPVIPLVDTADLIGAGVYGIYYTGAFDAYRPVAAKNKDGKFDQPIYVGKAVPKGARKGGLSFDASQGRPLRDRLRIHANSIDSVDNLRLDDFHYRALVVDDIWIPLGENMLIEKFRPIWNLVIDGFGNKTPGARRETQYRSAWDVLHPGRKGFENLASGGITAEALVVRVKEFFEGKAVPQIPIEEAADEGITDGQE